MPANVAVRDRAIVTAGLANDVEEVNQYAAIEPEPAEMVEQYDPETTNSVTSLAIVVLLVKEGREAWAADDADTAG
jgi:hypothetical protein